jgi:hypothetical protein
MNDMRAGKEATADVESVLREVRTRGLADREKLLKSVCQLLQRLNKEALFCIEVATGQKKDEHIDKSPSRFMSLRKHWLDTWNDASRELDSLFSRFLSIETHSEEIHKFSRPLRGVDLSPSDAEGKVEADVGV